MSKQKLSLQEQLLKSGLVSSAQVKTVKAEKRKQTQMQRNNNVRINDEAKDLALKAQAEKAERDRELNHLRKQQEAQKELAAQIKQLIEANRLAQDDDGLAYHFSDQNRMKTLYVSDAMRGQIINGQLAIVKLAQNYEVVAAETAQKISARDPASVIVLNERTQENTGKQNDASEQNDPYADYQIPDDLIW